MTKRILKVLFYADPTTLLDDLNFVMDPPVREEDLDKQFSLGDHKWVFIDLGKPDEAARRWNNVKDIAAEVYQWVNCRSGFDTRLYEDVFIRFVTTYQVNFRIRTLSYLYKPPK